MRLPIAFAREGDPTPAGPSGRGKHLDLRGPPEASLHTDPADRHGLAKTAVKYPP